jgi:hypothetical protein
MVWTVGEKMVSFLLLVQVARCVCPLTVLRIKLDRRPVRDLAEPHVQVLSFPRLEEEHVVAVVELGQLVELVQLGLGVELGVFAAVREHRGEVIEKVPVPFFPCLKLAAWSCDTPETSSAIVDLIRLDQEPGYTDL